MFLRRMVSFCGWICLFLSVIQIASANNKEFPGRDLYPNIPFIELADLQAKFKEVMIVDVRSTYEYDTLHVKGALNVPLASKSFVSSMKKLRDNSTLPIIVYCNGKTCMKSYKAALKCQSANIENVTAFDAGIMDWARNNPDRAMLLGKTLKDPKKLISKAEFHKHLISPEAFENRIAKSDDLVLDVRDRFQREGISLFVGREYRVYLDDKKRLDRFIRKAKGKRKALLIYDAAGKQVRWLQYYLQERGVRSYYFMEGGIRKYYKAMKESDFNKSASAR
jgi:rhodanese-related sulfurtransferase